jgi:hypothetical protein
MNLLQKWWRRKRFGIDFDGWKLCYFVEPVPIYSHPANPTENPESEIIHRSIEIARVNFDIRHGRWFKVLRPDGWIHEADLNMERRRYRERYGK